MYVRLCIKKFIQEKILMPNYYTTNAIYDNLSGIEHNFVWASGNAWILIYGNKEEVDPKFIAFVHGTSWVGDSVLMESVASISLQTGLPVLFIRFDDNAIDVENVDLWNSEDRTFHTITLGELKDVFRDNGLNVASGTCDKYLNKQKSSAYHEWQRNTLGNAIVVSDIDLIRVDPQNNEAKEICELKRSYYSLADWNPYSDDYINFNLLYNMTKETSIEFKIVYNKRERNPWNDIHDPVKIYSYTTNTPVLLHAECSFSDFVEGR